MKQFIIGLFATLAILFSSSVLAADLGSVATNLTQPISAARYAFNFGCYLIGAYCLVSTLFRYMRHRQNPQEAPLSSVIILLIIGIVLILLPLSYQLTHVLASDGGISDVLPGN